MNAFQTEVRAKWVLLGEHAVLRGGPALVFPHASQSLRLLFVSDPRSPGLEVDPPEAREMVLELLSSALPRIAMDSLRGRLTIASTITSGAGFGSSAALSVALSRFALSHADPAGAEVRTLATRLEDRFHGKSSGMDVHAVAIGSPLLYRVGAEPRVLRFRRFPRFTFHDTGLRTGTRAMIERVDAWRRAHPDRAATMDARMGEATLSALEALERYAEGEDAALAPLADALTAGRAVFGEWGLIPPEIEGLEGRLRAEGAFATKLTGAGGGGFLVALRPDSML